MSEKLQFHVDLEQAVLLRHLDRRESLLYKQLDDIDHDQHLPN